MDKNIKSIFLTPLSLLYRVSPESEIKLLYFLKLHEKLNLKSPRSYNEKLNWLKLYYRNALMPKCADKFLARDYITGKGYGEFLPKLYWHGDTPKEIPFDSLPDSFVIKSTSGSGNNIIVHDKAKLDIPSTVNTIKKWMKEKVFHLWKKLPK